MTRPNIVLIVADDLGFSDLGCYGGEIGTPNLDALARSGVRMTEYYTTPRCAPSRASLLTGRHPHETGIGVLTANDGPAGYPGSLNPSIPTVAEHLRAAGYRTGLSGKWHVSSDVESPNDSWPNRRGFDEFYGILPGSASYFQPRALYRNEERIDHEPLESDDYYVTDAITENALGFISDAADDPFFLYVAYTAPHWPLHARESDIDDQSGRFDAGWDTLREQRLSKQTSLGIFTEDQALSARDAREQPWSDVDDPRWEARRMEVYAAQVAAMDRGIGDILELLRSEDRLDDTIVIFVSDNGGCDEAFPAGSPILRNQTICPPTTRDGEEVKSGNVEGLMPGPEATYSTYGRAWANLSNTPFRLYKRWVHEGGIASPLIVSWPNGRLPSGSIVGGAAHIIDMLPTLVDAAGAEADVSDLTGTSLLEAWRGGPLPPNRTLYWEHVGNAAIRRGNWKLVREYGLPWELYDLSTDRAELDDRASSEPDIVAGLSGEWQRWADSHGVIPWEQMLDIGNYRRIYPPPTDST